MSSEILFRRLSRVKPFLHDSEANVQRGGPTRLRTFIVLFLPHRLRDLRQSAQQRRVFQPQFVIDRRRPTHDSSSWNVAGNAALRGHNGAIADLAMAHDTDLPCQNHVIPHLSRTGKADLRRSSEFSQMCEP